MPIIKGRKKLPWGQEEAGWVPTKKLTEEL